MGWIELEPPVKALPQNLTVTVKDGRFETYFSKSATAALEINGSACDAFVDLDKRALILVFAENPGKFRCPVRSGGEVSIQGLGSALSKHGILKPGKAEFLGRDPEEKFALAFNLESIWSPYAEPPSALTEEPPANPLPAEPTADPDPQVAIAWLPEQFAPGDRVEVAEDYCHPVTGTPTLKGDKGEIIKLSGNGFAFVRPDYAIGKSAGRKVPVSILRRLPPITTPPSPATFHVPAETARPDDPSSPFALGDRVRTTKESISRAGNTVKGGAVGTVIREELAFDNDCKRVFVDLDGGGKAWIRTELLERVR